MADRLRLRFSKLGPVRFTSHRDVARMWERALRRRGVPVARSQGFSPRPLVSFGLALPTGCESVAEYLDVTLAEGADPAFLPADEERSATLTRELSECLPPGVDAVAAAAVPHGSGSLQQQVTSCTWELEVAGVAATELARRVEGLLDAPTTLVRRERKGRTLDDDLRPSVRSLTVLAPQRSAPGEPAGRLRADLATSPRGVRPRELVQALGTDLVLTRACRTQQWIERDGARWEPLPAPGTGWAPTAPHAVGRAS
jgi:radical SAM-linked protein